MSRPLRLVVIAGFPVLPADAAGGKIRIVQLARALCEFGVDVTIVAPFHVTQTKALAAAEPFKLVEVPYPFLIPFLFTDRPFPYGALVSLHPGYRALVPVSLTDFDVCQVEHPAFIDVLDDLPRSVPVVYGAQNVEFDYTWAESFSPLIGRIAGGRVRKLEQRLVDRANHVLACSAADKRRLGELYGADPERVTLVPNGIRSVSDPSRGSASERTPKTPLRAPYRRRAIFAGSSVMHNHEAVASIVHQVAPTLADEVEFVIVGPCARRVRGSRPSNVRLDPDGEVSDWVGPDVVGLNPVIQGSGTSLKTLHYLAHGLPVLATPFGLRGYEELERWATIAEIGDFANRLRSDFPEPKGIEAHLEPYEWRRIARSALKVYEDLAGRSQEQ